MVGAKLATVKNGENQYTNRGWSNSTTLCNAQASEHLKVGITAIKEAKKVQSQGIPELIRKVETGEVKVSVAADVTTLSSPACRQAPASSLPSNRFSNN